MTEFQDKVQKAIQEGKAWIVTYYGRRRVVSYDESTGWAETINADDPRDRRSFLVGIGEIRIGS